MKILITTDWDIPTVNGVVTSVRNLCRVLRQIGHDVRILTLRQSDSQEKQDKDTWNLHSIGIGKIYPQARMAVGLNRRIWREILAWQPDIVHSQCEFSTFHWARRIAEYCDIPLIHTYHTIYEDYTHYFSPSQAIGKKAAAVFSNAILNHTDSVIAPTDKTAELLRGYGVRTPIETVSTGIDLSTYAAPIPVEQRKELRASLGIDENRIVLLSLGRLAKEKNIHEIIAMMETAPRETVLVVAGDGPYRETLQHQARHLSNQRKIIFTGMISPKETPLYYNMADIFVSASTSETQGLTYLEAMASGLPLLCREDSCLSGIVTQEVEGIFFSDQEGFRQGVQRLAGDHAFRNAMGTRGKLRANAFSMESFGQRVSSIYYDTLMLKENLAKYRRFAI